MSLRSGTLYAIQRILVYSNHPVSSAIWAAYGLVATIVFACLLLADVALFVFGDELLPTVSASWPGEIAATLVAIFAPAHLLELGRIAKRCIRSLMKAFTRQMPH